MPEIESLLFGYGFSAFIVFIFGLISLCEGICFGKVSKNEAKAHAAIVLLFAVFWPLMLFVAIISSPFWVAYLAYQRYKELPEE